MTGRHTERLVDAPGRIWSIYKATCQTTSKSYVGITSWPISRRWSGHCSEAKRGKSRSPLHRAIRKYGRDDFLVEMLGAVVTFEEAAAIERQEIVTHRTMVPTGYNLTSGGEGTVGIVKSAITRARLAASQKGIPKPRTPEHQAKLAAARRGTKATDQARANMSASHRGKPLSPTHRANIGAANKGRQHSEKELANLDWTGRKHTVEAREKISVSQTGKKRGPHKEATKAKMSVAQRGKIRGPMPAEHRGKISAALTGLKHKPHKKISAQDRLKQSIRTRLRRSQNPMAGIKPVNGRWRAEIWVKNRSVNLGIFDTMEEARAAYLKAIHALLNPAD